MSICKICNNNGFPNIAITWKNDSGKYTPLALDGTPHKHFQPTKKIPEPNDYPNPITLPANGNGDSNKKLQTEQTQIRNNMFQIDLNNLNVIRVLHAALGEYIQWKEGKK